MINDFNKGKNRTAEKETEDSSSRRKKIRETVDLVTLQSSKVRCLEVDFDTCCEES